MIVSIRYITGMYHATPYGRNVNEGSIEYPPSPYRIIRALIDTWKRKLKTVNNDTVLNLLGKLSEGPSYYLPNISEGTIANYLDSNENPKSQQLIYDSFVSINPHEKVLIFWDNVYLELDEVNILTKLLENLNYLGRSESWVEMKVENNVSEKPNCTLQNMSTHQHTVKTALPVPMNGYIKQGHSIDEWLNAITYDTNDLLTKKIDRPPGLIYKSYNVPADIVKVKTNYTINNTSIKKTYGVIYALNSSVLPLITDSLLIGERFHTKILGIYKKIFGKISPTLSGICPDGSIMKGHRHIFISPLDINNDGRIDHIMIKTKNELTDNEIYCFDIIHSLWQDNGKPDIKLIPTEWLYNKESKQLMKSKIFESKTPFIFNKHFRQGRGNYLDWIKKQVIEELSYIGLPEPLEINPIERVSDAHQFLWLDFYRNRKGDTPRMGYGFRMIFNEPISLPFNIGYASHYGLGLFMPVGDDND